MAGNVIAALEIQFKASASDATANIKTLQAQLKALDGAAGDVTVSADTADALSKLKTLAAQAGSISGTAVIAGDGSGAITEIATVQKNLSAIPDEEVGITVDAGSAGEAIDSLGEKTKGLITMLKGAGLIAAGKAVGEFAMDLVDAASDAQQIENKIINLTANDAGAAAKASVAYEKIFGYAEKLNAQYGLNAIGVADMTTNFAGAYKGLGIGLETATDYAIRLSDAAIDYASVLNMTPGEVGNIFMALMKGNTAVADSVSIFGLTIDQLTARAKDMNAEGLIPDGIEKANWKFVALLDKIEENGKKLGFEGDWERTAKEFANQTTILGEQWQTLKQTAGSYLLPAATDIVTGLNSIMGAITSFVTESGKSSFVKDMSQYFGGMELSGTEIDKIVAGVTGQADGILAAVGDAKAKLDTASSSMQTSMKTFLKILSFAYTGELDDQAESELVAAYQAFKEAQEKQIDEGRSSMLSQLLAFTDPELINSEATNAGIDMINAYYDGAKSAIEARSEELAKQIREAFAEGGIDEAEQEAIRQRALESAQLTMRDAMVQNEAQQQLYLDNATSSGNLSAESVEALYEGMMGSTADSRKALYDAYQGLMLPLYEMAIQSGQDPKTVTKDVTASYEASIDRMRVNTISTLVRSLMGSEQYAMEQWGGFDPDTSNAMRARNETGVIDAFMTRFAGLVDGEHGERGIRDYAAEGMATPEMLKVLEMYDVFGAVANEGNGVWERFFPGGQAPEDLNLFDWVGEYIQNGFALAPDGGGSALDGISSDIGSLPGKMDEVASAARATADAINNKQFMANVYVGQYQLGKITSEGMSKYGQVDGR